MRDSNEMYFLHLIRDRQPVSRTDLAKETGLRAGTVSVVVNRLMKAGFVYEAEEAPSKGAGVLFIFRSTPKKHMQLRLVSGSRNRSLS